MPEKGVGWKFTDNCLACGRQLDGKGTKRHLLINGYSVGYVCYGEKICGNQNVRMELLRIALRTSKEINRIKVGNYVEMREL